MLLKHKKCTVHGAVRYFAWVSHQYLRRSLSSHCCTVARVQYSCRPTPCLSSDPAELCLTPSPAHNPPTVHYEIHFSVLAWAASLTLPLHPTPPGPVPPILNGEVSILYTYICMYVFCFTTRKPVFCFSVCCAHLETPNC